jgi:hypothetical protein
LHLSCNFEICLFSKLLPDHLRAQFRHGSNYSKALQSSRKSLLNLIESKYVHTKINFKVSQAITASYKLHKICPFILGKFLLHLSLTH